MSSINDDLPEPDTPVTATSLPSGTSTVMFFRLFARAPRMVRCLPLPDRRSVGNGDARSAGEILPRDRFGGLGHPIGCAGDDDASAVRARARPHIDHVIGGAQHVEIVFDDEHGVAQIAQLAQHVDQPGGVARMQADRRLVEHVQHARQARAQQRSESQPLRFSGREGGRGSIEREITDADVDQPPHARLQIDHDRFGDDPFFRRDRRSELIDPRGQLIQRQFATRR